jgi:hypothetical protein
MKQSHNSWYNLTNTIPVLGFISPKQDRACEYRKKLRGKM